MECKKSEILMMKYLDGEISEFEYLLLKHHIIICSACQKYFDFCSHICSSFELINDDLAPENFELRVMDKIKNIKCPHKRHIQR